VVHRPARAVGAGQVRHSAGRQFPLARKQPGGMIAFILRGEKNEISCANGSELRDNDSNPGGLAIWHGTGRMNRNDQFEAEAMEAVSERDHFSLQRLPNRALYGLPISSYEVRRPSPIILVV